MTASTMIFDTAINPETSPYSLQRDPTKKIIDNIEFIPVTDTIFEKDEAGKRIMKKIRYMAEHNSIYVEDQIKSGVSPKYGMGLSGEEKKSRSDVIILERGKITVDGEMKPNLVEYLQKCNFNGSNPNRDPKKTVLFYYNDVKEKAKKEYSKYKLVDRARSLVASLEGNTRKLIDVAMSLHLDTNMTEDQLLLSMRNKAESDPELIIGIISEDKAEIDLIVHKCLEYGIIEFTGFAYRYPNAKENIKGFSGKQKPEIAFKSFVKWLGEDEGQGDLATLRKLIDRHEKKLAEKAA